MKRLPCFLIGVVLSLSTVGVCRGEVTTEYNGLTPEHVTQALGTPTSKVGTTTSALAYWYYGGTRVTFTSGKVSEISFPTAPVSPPRRGHETPTSATLTQPSTFGTTTNVDGVNADSTYLGQLSKNRYAPDSTSNQYGQYGTPYGNTLNNRFGTYGNPYSSKSWTNPYATDAPRIYAQDGTYLGKLSSNRYDPESVSNPYGRYGNPYGNTVNNRYGTYGSRYSPQSWSNPYASSAPKVYGTPQTAPVLQWPYAPSSVR